MTLSPCDCEVPELAINPERKCPVCGGFISFNGPEYQDDIRDFLAWSSSTKIQVDEPEQRCIVCWSAESRCGCEAPKFLHEVVDPLDRSPSEDGWPRFDDDDNLPRPTRTITREFGEMPVTEAGWDAIDPRKHKG